MVCLYFLQYNVASLLPILDMIQLDMVTLNTGSLQCHPALAYLESTQVNPPEYVPTFVTNNKCKWLISFYGLIECCLNGIFRLNIFFMVNSSITRASGIRQNNLIGLHVSSLYSFKPMAQWHKIQVKYKQCKFYLHEFDSIMIGY